MNYFQLQFLIEQAACELIQEQLMALGALSISMEAGKEQQALFQVTPGQQPLWNKIKITALFSESENQQDLHQLIQQQLSLSISDYTLDYLAEQDWVRLTQAQFPAQCFADRLWICPQWEENTDHLSGAVVKIDPGLAFGTGTHATTALCLQWLAEHPPQGLTVVDYGCGSGILSLAALALGAKKVYAVDHDEQALIATENNARLNAFVDKDNLTICTPEQCKQLPVRLVLANILANPLIELMDTLTRQVAAHGRLILSGILEQEMERVVRPYSRAFCLETVMQQDEWVRLEWVKKT